MQTLFLDFETYFDKDYTLKKLSTSQYVRDKRFKAHGAQFAWGSFSAPEWVPHSDLTRFFASIKWDETTLVAHHAHFEGFILHTHYDAHPARYLCTMSAARAIHQGQQGVGLDELAKFHQLPGKPETLTKTKGIYDLPPELETEVAQYCANDLLLTQEFSRLYLDKLPLKELDLIDAFVSMFARPRLHIDVKRAQRARVTAKLMTRAAVRATGHSFKEISGDKSFVALLKEHDVDCPTKPGKRGPIPALAKTDHEFDTLLGHENETIRNLAAARKTVSSRIEETRATRLMEMGSTADGMLAVYYNYYGAHTGRLSGGDKMNLANLPRGGELRKSILAPEGHSIVVADSSQIECRTEAAVFDETSLLTIFENGEDPYCTLAGEIFRRPITKADELERFVGKCARLGLGYRMGANHFHQVLATGQMGRRVFIPLNECHNIVQVYRSLHPNIVNGWTLADDWIRFMCFGTGTMAFKFLTIDAKERRIYLPNEMWLSYPQLHCFKGKYTYWNGRYAKNLHGGVVVENLIQALSRIIVTDALLEIRKQYPVVMHTYDENTWVCPTDQAQEAAAFGLTAMRKRPAWLPNVPLDAETKYAEYYSK